jgi:hypothetical protein
MAPVMAQDDAADGPIVGVPGFDMLFETVDPGFLAGDNTIYYPWVANDDDFGLGDADTSISVQNLENRDSQIWIYTGNGDGTWSLATTAFLASFASKTFPAASLGIAAGEGAPVAVTAFHRVPGETVPGFPVGAFLAETEVILSKPAEVEGDFTQVVACVVNVYTADGSFGSPFPFLAAVSFTWTGVDYTANEDWVEWDNQGDLQDILETVNAGNTGALINPFGGLNVDGDCLDATAVIDGGSTASFLDSVAIGGVAKQAVQGEALPMTSEVDTAVSGYNALNGIEVYRFDEWYLPIVQTNCGPGGCWDSMIRVANVSGQNASVEIRFFPADDGSGSLATGFQIQGLVNGGDTWHVNLGDLVPDGWVGSAHIYSDGQVFAMVDRYKVGYNMWITNTGSSADYENLAQVENAQQRYVLFAPHVLLDYFGWNTGINVANLANVDNNVSIQYFNMLGNATQVLNQRLAAHGMTYFYDPSINAQNISEQDVTTDPNAGVVGSALIWSDEPVAAAIDATKYPETDPTGGVDLFQATSYSATQNVFNWQAVPLIQKGSPIDGMGDTSGINIMNPNAAAVTANVYFVNPSGFNAQNFGVSSVTIPGFANGFVYSLWQNNLPNGFTGAAQVVASQPVAAVSANVNYEVDGDGSAIFNAFNPCGLYRTTGACTFGDPFDPTGRSFTKTFVDQFGDPVAGVGFQVSSTPGTTDFPYTRDGVSGVDGTRTFSNMPLGTYDLFVTSLPAGYAPVDPTEVQETFTISAGDDVELTNVLELLGGNFTKEVIVAGTGDESDDNGIEFGTGIGLEGVNVVVFASGGMTGEGDPVLGDVVLDVVTGADGSVTGSLIPGTYVLCLYDADGTATIVGSETVIDVDLGLTADGACAAGFDVFTIDDEETSVFLVNEVEVLGQIDIGTTIERDVFLQWGEFEVCIWDAAEADGLDGLVELECKDVDAADVFTYDEAAETDESTGFYFAGLPSGTYVLTAVGANASAISNAFTYEVLLDARDGLLPDVDETEVVDNVGPLSDGGEWDFLITGAERSDRAAPDFNVIMEIEPGPGQDVDNNVE